MLLLLLGVVCLRVRFDHQRRSVVVARRRRREEEAATTTKVPVLPPSLADEISLLAACLWLLEDQFLPHCPSSPLLGRSQEAEPCS